jgi:hypothetical protein
LANSSMPIANGSAAATALHPATTEVNATSSPIHSASASLNHTVPIPSRYPGFAVLVGSRTCNATRAATRIFNSMSRPTGSDALKMNATFPMPMNGTQFATVGASDMLEANRTEAPAVSPPVPARWSTKSNGNLVNPTLPVSKSDAGVTTLVGTKLGYTKRAEPTSNVEDPNPATWTTDSNGIMHGLASATSTEDARFTTLVKERRQTITSISTHVSSSQRATT